MSMSEVKAPEAFEAPQEPVEDCRPCQCIEQPFRISTVV